MNAIVASGRPYRRARRSSFAAATSSASYVQYTRRESRGASASVASTQGDHTDDERRHHAEPSGLGEHGDRVYHRVSRPLAAMSGLTSTCGSAMTHFRHAVTQNRSQSHSDSLPPKPTIGCCSARARGPATSAYGGLASGVVLFFSHRTSRTISPGAARLRARWSWPRSRIWCSEESPVRIGHSTIFHPDGTEPRSQADPATRPFDRAERASASCHPWRRAHIRQGRRPVPGAAWPPSSPPVGDVAFGTSTATSTSSTGWGCGR